MTESRGISRRHVLAIAATAAGGSITTATAVMGTSTPAQAAKALWLFDVDRLRRVIDPQRRQRFDHSPLLQAPATKADPQLL
jgi:hypothetical protein